MIKQRKRFVGRAIGGPASGMEIGADSEGVDVPVPVGGGRFGAAKYRWTGAGAWLYIDTDPEGVTIPLNYRAPRP